MRASKFMVAPWYVYAINLHYFLVGLKTKKDTGLNSSFKGVEIEGG